MRLFANLIDQFRIPMPRAAFNEFILVQDPLDNFPILLRVWKIHGLTFGGGAVAMLQQVLSIYLQGGSARKVCHLDMEV
jgi:hypothetical protein